VGCTDFPTAFLPRHIDTTPVPPGVVFHYLVRAALPIQGSWGLDSSGQERSVPCAF
jgi:hypothetical protein